MTIEEKAKKYAGKVRVAPAVPGAVVEMITDVARCAYIDGAREARAQRWYNPKEKMPEDDEDVIIFDGEKFQIAYFDGCRWYNTDAGNYEFPERWTQIPPDKTIRS